MGNLDEYRGDVWYEEWRRGLPKGSMSSRQIDEAYDRDVSPEILVQNTVQRRQTTRYAEELSELEYAAEEEYLRHCEPEIECEQF